MQRAASGANQKFPHNVTCQRVTPYTTTNTLALGTICIGFHVLDWSKSSQIDDNDASVALGKIGYKFNFASSIPSTSPQHRFLLLFLLFQFVSLSINQNCQRLGKKREKERGNSNTHFYWRKMASSLRGRGKGLTVLMSASVAICPFAHNANNSGGGLDWTGQDDWTDGRIAMFWQPIYLLSASSNKRQLVWFIGSFSGRVSGKEELDSGRVVDDLLLLFRSVAVAWALEPLLRVKGLLASAHLINLVNYSTAAAARVSKINRRLFFSNIKHKSVAVVSLSRGHFFLFLLLRPILKPKR